MSSATAGLAGAWPRLTGTVAATSPTSTEIGAQNQQACFLLQGSPVDGVANNYLERPKFDPAKHMPFAGCEEWM